MASSSTSPKRETIRIGSFWFGVSVALLISPAQAEQVERKISVKEGVGLVRMALASQHLADGFDDALEQEDEPFLYYPILGAVEGINTYYAVNAWTGDVWDSHECRSLTSPALRNAQRKIKQRFRGDELKEYPRLHNLRPYNYNLDPCQ